jgi:RNA polymerase sigma factor (sigma-70 family)
MQPAGVSAPLILEDPECQGSSGTDLACALEPDEIAVVHDEHERIVLALQTLSIRDRELVWLREVLELDYRSIARRIESNTGSVRVACHRARQRLESAYRSLESDQT